ncbi:MAG: hypothetical protein P4L58_03365 [Candidatus Pacebacteria bacterium]|nr:hypothetical protein [Candidatus Paceibacterota bacterium]
MTPFSPQAELSAGAKIISYGFRLPDRQPDKIINSGYPGNVFCYTVE